MSKIVVALGGNALGITVEEQIEKARIAAKTIVDLVEEGHDIVLAHGNGPQVGQIRLAFENGFKENVAPFMPFPECIALSQGYIGYHLQQSIDLELMKRNVKKGVVTIVTQIEVSKDDKAFLKPSKPVGGYYTKEEASAIMEKTGDTYIEDAGRGYRRAVASPMPINIREIEAVKTLVQANNVVVACGGGGVPVVLSDDNTYSGIDAVVDKDFASCKMAEMLDFDMLFILTAIDKAYLNFNTEEQVGLPLLTSDEAQKYIDEGHFAPGSMLPKVKACMEFVKNNENKTAIIAKLEEASLALSGKSGTKFIK